MLKIPKKIEYVLNCLSQNGFDAYIVGGCVRDLMRGKVPNDFDITTNAKPDDVKRIFEKTVATGEKHGTVTVIIEKEAIEVTTFRTEQGYSDSRRPDMVEFVSELKSDLARRDFTVNAMAYNKKTGIVDFFNGRKDLENKILRAVGNPYERFNEDALRILRLFRFSSQLKFEIEDQTKSAALKCADTLKKISVERILNELSRAISGEKVIALSPLIKNGYLDFLKINQLPSFEKIQNIDQKDLRFFAFIHFSSNNPVETLKLLKAPNKTLEYYEILKLLLEMPLPTTKINIKNMLYLSSPKLLKDYFEFEEKIFGINTQSLKRLLDEIIENNEPYLISHLKINGEILVKMGLRGKEICCTLERLREEVMNNPEKNNFEDLKALI